MASFGYGIASLRDHAESLGVRFCRHSDSCGITIFGWCAEQLGRLRWCRGWRRWRTTFWITIGRTIYHPDVIVDAVTASPVQVRHELVHVERQLATGVLWWLSRYVISWRFRFREEALAYLIDIRAGTPMLHVIRRLQTDYRIRHTTKMMSEWFADHLAREDDSR